MAHWANNPPNSNSSRRRWDLEDRASLNNLKYHIAAEGCSDMQYELARQLLDGTVEEQNHQSSNEKAVHWLCCATQQGHEASADLLRKCYENGCGITPENEDKVRCCLSMTPGERAARKAARELFACLSNGNEHITPKQLERKMRQIYNMQKKRRRRGDSVSSASEDEAGDDDRRRGGGDAAALRQALGNGEANEAGADDLPMLNVHDVAGGRITEENLVAAADNYAAGRMPVVNDALTNRISVPHPATLDHVPCLHRFFFHPVLFLTLLYHRLVNFVSSLEFSPGLRFALSVAVYWLLYNNNLNAFIPIAFYYLCLGVMVWSSCRMLKSKQDYIDFRIWSGLFLRYGDHNVEADLSENRFLKNNMRPYLHFFVAFIGNMVIYPFVKTDWLPYSELTIVSFLFVFATMFSFMYNSPHAFPDIVTLTSFGVNVLAKYPYEMDEVVTTGWRFLDLKVPTFCSFIIGNGIEFCLNCRTALYLLIPGFLVLLAKRSRWHGIYTNLIPHCVTLCWLSLCINCSQSSTMFGMVRATLGMAGVLLFLPLFGIVSLLVPVFVAIDWMGFTDPATRYGSTFAAGLLAVVASCYLALNRRTQKYITLLHIVIALIASCALTFPYMTSNFKDASRYANIGATTPSVSHRLFDSDHSHHISWHRFHALCGQPSWDNGNKIKSQIRCAHLLGMPVSWEGTVADVTIARVANTLDEYINAYLPAWLGDVVRCFYGSDPLKLTSGSNCPDRDDLLCDELQRLLKQLKYVTKCSLHDWNSYEYEVTVKMPTSGLLTKSANVLLQAGHVFANITHKLAAGDRIHFYGTLLNTHVPTDGKREDYRLGSSYTFVNVLAMECVACQARDLPAISVEHLQHSPMKARMRDLMRGIKYLLNVLFSPLITFK